MINAWSVGRSTRRIKEVESTEAMMALATLMCASQFVHPVSTVCCTCRSSAFAKLICCSSAAFILVRCNRALQDATNLNIDGNVRVGVSLAVSVNRNDINVMKKLNQKKENMAEGLRNSRQKRLEEFKLPRRIASKWTAVNIGLSCWLGTMQQSLNERGPKYRGDFLGWEMVRALAPGVRSLRFEE